MFESINLDYQTLLQFLIKWASSGQGQELGDITRQRSQLVDSNRNGAVAANKAQHVK